jgi:hypothetical protein
MEKTRPSSQGSYNLFLSAKNPDDVIRAYALKVAAEHPVQFGQRPLDVRPGLDLLELKATRSMYFQKLDSRFLKLFHFKNLQVVMMVSTNMFDLKSIYLFYIYGALSCSKLMQMYIHT